MKTIEIKSDIDPVLRQRNKVPQILIDAFQLENISLTLDEAKSVVSHPLPQGIKQMLNTKLENTHHSGIYEYELINKIHNNFLSGLVKYFDFNLNDKAPENTPKRVSKINTRKTTSLSHKDLEKDLANLTLKKLGWLK